jgi:hypothetical protein
LGSGCATVNPQSAARLAGEAQLTTRSIAEALEASRHGLDTFIEGQTLQAKLSGRSELTPTALCSVRAVQRSLRLRVILLRKLGLLYEHLAELARLDDSEGAPIYDELMAEIDRYELLPDASPGPTCPDPDPPLSAAAPAQLSGPAPSLPLSRSASLRLGSQQLRAVLGRFLTLWESERPIYLSIQRQTALAQKSLTRTLLLKYGTLSPSGLFAPQLRDLGMDWDDSAYLDQQSHYSAEQKTAMRDAILAVLDRRSERRAAEEEARYAQHSELLRLLVRQHQTLEAGQPLDLRQLTWFLLPLLRGAAAVRAATAGSCSASSP